MEFEDRRVTTGTLSKVVRINIECIRYYERTGLVSLPSSSDGGQRIYGKADQKRLAFIKCCRKPGFAPDGIRILIDLAAAESRTFQKSI